MKHENWVPQILRDAYGDLTRDLERVDEQHPGSEFLRGLLLNRKRFLEPLVTRDEMKAVWNTLRRRNPTGRELEFVSACRQACWFHQERTRADAKRQARKLLQLVSKLSGELKSADPAIAPHDVYALLAPEDRPVVQKLELRDYFRYAY